jgi:hypothetical protein
LTRRLSTHNPKPGFCRPFEARSVGEHRSLPHQQLPRFMKHQNHLLIRAIMSRHVGLEGLGPENRAEARNYKLRGR